MKSESVKYLQEDSWKYLYHIEGKIQESIFLTWNRTQKTLTVKKKKMKLDFFKVKEFSLLKGTIKRGQTRRRGACVCVYEYDKGLVKNIYRTPTT